jgi:hypothetical protein
MEKEKSSVEILKEIAKRSDWEFKANEQTINLRHGQSHRDVIIRNYNVPDSYFISAQLNKLFKYKIYSGVFFPIKGYDSYKLLIRKRDFTDKLSFRKDKLRFRIGNSSFDSQIYIETNNDIQTHKLLSNSKVQMEIIDFLNYTVRLQIGINELNPNFNKELEGKTYLSVFTFLEWMLDKELIDKAFKLGELLNSKLNQK